MNEARITQHAGSTAWLRHKEQVWKARTDSGESAIRDLIERIYAYTHQSNLDLSQARAILRERIHCDLPASITDREMVKIAAKRLEAPSRTSLPSSLEVIDLVASVDMRRYSFTSNTPHSDAPKIGETLNHWDIPTCLERLRSITKRELAEAPRWKQNRAVSALLLDSGFKVLAWAWNTNAVIRTHHAEWNLCAALESGGFGSQRKIPVDATLYVSLKPCRMCAARIWECSENPTRIRVIYLENDPGPLAQGTLLEAGSPARKRFLSENFVHIPSQVSPYQWI